MSLSRWFSHVFSTLNSCGLSVHLVFFFSFSLPWCVAQLPQEDLREVKRGEAYAHSYWAFHPVHAEALVEAAHKALFRHDLAHGSRNGAVRMASHSCRLHAPPHHVQRVGGRLTDESCTRPKRQSLVRVRLRTTCLFWGK